VPQRIKSAALREKAMNDAIEEKLDKLVELCWQGEDLVLSRDKELTDWEVGEEFVALSKEVASYYRPLVEKLVEARILTVNIVPQCAVYEVDVVLPQRKSYFNEGKILLFIGEEQVNGRDGKLKCEFQKSTR
jgi:hypothetical protein